MRFADAVARFRWSASPGTHIFFSSRVAAHSESKELKSCLFDANRYIQAMILAVETEQETDGRWIAEVPQIPGALAYGADRQEAISRVEALALRVLADRVEHGEMPQELAEVFSVAV